MDDVFSSRSFQLSLMVHLQWLAACSAKEDGCYAAIMIYDMIKRDMAYEVGNSACSSK